MDRRRMSAALQTADLGEAALDFVKAGSARPTPDTTAAVAAPVQSAGGEESRQRENGMQPRLRLGDDAEVEPEAGLVSLTVRVPRRVPPFFSNLLPEGHLREYLAFPTTRSP